MTEFIVVLVVIVAFALILYRLDSYFNKKGKQ